MKIAVVGAGAIGAYVGAALHRGSADVHLIARGEHLEVMRRKGVTVLSNWLPVLAYLASSGALTLTGLGGVE